jgi:thiamine biosynthesis protein ThiS
MKILVNGKPSEVDAGTTVAQVLATLEIETRQVAVEVNCDLVPRKCHAEHLLRDGDKIEIVTLVGGG